MRKRNIIIGFLVVIAIIVLWVAVGFLNTLEVTTYVVEIPDLPEELQDF